MASGAEARFGFIEQEDFNSPALGTIQEWVPFLSETLSVTIEQLDATPSLDRFATGPFLDGRTTINGEVRCVPLPNAIRPFLFGVTGAETVTYTGSAAHHRFIPRQTVYDTFGNALPPMTIEVYRGIGQAFRYFAAMVAEIALNIPQGGLPSLSAALVARASSLTPPQAATMPPHLPWSWDQASVSIAGVANAQFEDLTITFQQALAPQHGLGAAPSLAQRIIRTGPQEVLVRGQMVFDSTSEYERFIGRDVRQLVVTLRGTETIATSYRNTLEVDIPRLKYTAFSPSVDGWGIVRAALDGVGEWDTVSRYAIQFTLVNCSVSPPIVEGEWGAGGWAAMEWAGT